MIYGAAETQMRKPALGAISGKLKTRLLINSLGKPSRDENYIYLSAFDSIRKLLDKEKITKKQRFGCVVWRIWKKGGNVWNIMLVYPALDYLGVIFFPRRTGIGLIVFFKISFDNLCTFIF